MTTQEHALMIGLLASNLEALYALADLLKSRGVIVEADDLNAFWQIRSLDHRKASTQRAHEIYAQMAESVGIDTEASGISPVR